MTGTLYVLAIIGAVGNVIAALGNLYFVVTEGAVVNGVVGIGNLLVVALLVWTTRRLRRLGRCGT